MTRILASVLAAGALLSMIASTPASSQNKDKKPRAQSGPGIDFILDLGGSDMKPGKSKGLSPRGDPRYQRSQGKKKPSLGK